VTPVFERRREPGVMMEQGLNTEHHAVPGQYVTFIYNQGGSLLKWFRDTFAASERKRATEMGADIYAALISEIPAGPSRILVLPHFTVTGPPKFIADSCGLIAGLQLETARGDILKGILEGTTFYLRECLESLAGTGIEITNFCAAGGGSRSDAWIQICADILGRPFVRPKITEAGVLGAAIIAGTGSEVFSSLAAGVETMVELDRTYTPDPHKQKLYEGRFEKYKRLWPLMADYLRDLA
jgi:xylulokinase